jgi:anti-sigma regulatory factor (Ser/Thr protein kinase)
VAYCIPNALSCVSPVAFQLVERMNALPICGKEGGIDVALGLIEMITNAIEHGNLALSGAEKLALKARGEDFYLAELRRRAGIEPYRSRRVRVIFTPHPDKATFRIEDEGAGFDIQTLPDSTVLWNPFAPAGRGILLTRALLDEVRYNKRGNAVTVVKYREPRDTWGIGEGPPRDRQGRATPSAASARL